MTVNKSGRKVSQATTSVGGPADPSARYSWDGVRARGLIYEENKWTKWTAGLLFSVGVVEALGGLVSLVWMGLKVTFSQGVADWQAVFYAILAVVLLLLSVLFYRQATRMRERVVDCKQTFAMEALEEIRDNTLRSEIAEVIVLGVLGVTKSEVTKPAAPGPPSTGATTPARQPADPSC